MYFIPRNNTIYNYLAHTNKNRRYTATIFICIFLLVICFYGIYQPLTRSMIFYKNEYSQLKTQLQAFNELENSIQNYNALTKASTKRIIAHQKTSEQCHMQCRNHILKMVTLIAQHNLTLHTYSSCKETQKDWYNTYSAHFSIEATMSQLLTFIEILTDEFSMSRLSRFVLKQKDKDAFQADFEIAFLTIKK
jgi:hypothetical protein